MKKARVYVWKPVQLKMHDSTRNHRAKHRPKCKKAKKR
jgi:hypothetical protein